MTTFHIKLLYCLHFLTLNSYVRKGDIIFAREKKYVKETGKTLCIESSSSKIECFISILKISKRRNSSWRPLKVELEKGVFIPVCRAVGRSASPWEGPVVIYPLDWNKVDFFQNLGGGDHSHCPPDSDSLKCGAFTTSPKSFWSRIWRYYPTIFLLSGSNNQFWNNNSESSDQ